MDVEGTTFVQFSSLFVPLVFIYEVLIIIIKKNTSSGQHYTISDYGTIFDSSITCFSNQGNSCYCWVSNALVLNNSQLNLPKLKQLSLFLNTHA